MQIINRGANLRNTRQYIAHGKYADNTTAIQSLSCSNAIIVRDLFIELTENPKFWDDKHNTAWGLKYFTWQEPFEIYEAGLNISPNYWRENEYAKLKAWAKTALGWDLYHYKGMVKV